MTPSKKDRQNSRCTRKDQLCENRDQKTRDSLIEDYLPLLSAIAKRVHAKLRGHVELDDLISSERWPDAAVASFDPPGHLFRTFCTYRSGGIFDEVRRWTGCELVRGRRGNSRAEQALSNQAVAGRPTRNCRNISRQP